jgi:hypothetical protein
MRIYKIINFSIIFTSLSEITWNFVQHLHGLDQNCTLIRTKAKSSPTGKSISSITDHDYHHRQPRQPKNEAENDKELSSSAPNVEQNEMQDQSLHHHHSPLSSDISKEVNLTLPFMDDECEKKPTPIEKCRKEEKEVKEKVEEKESWQKILSIFLSCCSFPQSRHFAHHLMELPIFAGAVPTSLVNMRIGTNIWQIQKRILK